MLSLLDSAFDLFSSSESEPIYVQVFCDFIAGCIETGSDGKKSVGIADFLHEV